MINGKLIPPTAEWVQQRRKGAKTGNLNPYNCYVMAYSAVYGVGRPPANIWGQQDPEPWKALANTFNSTYSTGRPGKAATTTVTASATSISASVGASISSLVPISAGAVTPKIKDGVTAYMYWRSKYNKEHGRLPERGDWKALSKDVVNQIEAELKALKTGVPLKEKDGLSAKLQAVTSIHA